MREPIITIILPCFNEESQMVITIPTVDREIRRALSANQLPEAYEILVIDDGSEDDTWTVVDGLRQDFPALRALRFSRNFGKESAILAGLRNANGRCAILMDSDLQHPPAVFPEMIRLWLEGYEIVEGVKSDRGKESRLSKLNAKIFYKLFKRYSGLDLNNASDFKLLDRKVLDTWKDLNEQDPFFRGMAAWVGFKRTSVEFEVQDREHGTSKWSFFQLMRLSVNAITGFSAKPLLISAMLGAFFVLLFLIVAIQTLVNYLSGHAVEGFTTVILLQLFIGGLILLSLGMIGLYLARIFNETKRRPSYIISEDTGAEPASRPVPRADLMPRDDDSAENDEAHRDR